ncbi:MAG: hypothetical protein K0S47_542 [Herbinix sp.]|jgi:uncharacterized protein YhaN|nr:hypothetical protein [Herbinix sp.]
MQLKKLKLNYFGRFHNREIELKPGINLIYGKNEAGKSTIHTFIRGMLFGIERFRGRASKDDLYQKYLPWEYPGAYSGSMDLEIGDKVYRIARNFHANDKSVVILDLETGREITLTDNRISELIPGLTESAYKNTLSMEQLKAKTDAELSIQVRNYIANLSIAKSKEVNVAKAITSLSEQKKLRESSGILSQIAQLQEEITENLAAEVKIDALAVELRELMSKEQEYGKLRKNLHKQEESEEAERMDQLPAILEKYRIYQDLSMQMNQLDRKMEEIESRVQTGVKDQQSLELFSEQIKEAEKLSAAVTKWEETEEDLREELDRMETKKRKGFYLSTLPFIGVALAVLALSGFHPLGILGTAVILLISVGVTYQNFWQNEKKKLHITEQVKRCSQELSSYKNILEGIFNKNRVSALTELKLKYESMVKDYYAQAHFREQLKEGRNRKNELEDKKDQLYEVIMRYSLQFIKEDLLEDDTMDKLVQEISRRKQEAQKCKEALDEEYQDSIVKLEKIRWELSKLEGNEEKLLKNRDELSRLKQQQEESQVELEAIKMALSTIHSLSSEIHDSFGRELNDAVSDVISQITGDRYTDIKIDEKLEMKACHNGEYISLDKLSAGTMDQIYFSLRLAVADLLLGKDRVPLLLDDSFALYDEERVKAALRQISLRKQVLLFSCHSREKQLLDEMGLPYHYVDLSSQM